MMKKISILLAMLALMMFSALPVVADENTSEQYIYDSQNAYVDIAGDDNAVAIDQSISQSAFSPVYYDYCYPVWVYYPYWGWVLVCF
jgi:hypothetical protein